MRIYLPATLDELQDRPEATLGTRPAHAVTSALRAALPDEDEEGLEFAAQLMAADDSLDLVGLRPEAPALRVVVSVDVPDAEVTPGDPAVDGAPTLVVLAQPVPVSAAVCVHVDEPTMAADVRKAARGDKAALDRVDDADLLWYDATELATIPR
ncbi:hypothetical protein [Cellulomonas sp. HZM]|uniref:DUF6912 family protein n=1 Tax=Cellulomonas sp. HZM TaxID=1454010 RepID=UPI0004931C7E|nr:hypothetical protein [Cellulomonas sp. HZM]